MLVRQEDELDMLLAMARTRNLVPVVTGVDDPRSWKRRGKQRLQHWRVTLWKRTFWGGLKEVQSS